jgi:hypothetical protein
LSAKRRILAVAMSALVVWTGVLTTGWASALASKVAPAIAESNQAHDARTAREATGNSHHHQANRHKGHVDPHVDPHRAHGPRAPAGTAAPDHLAHTLPECLQACVEAATDPVLAVAAPLTLKSATVDFVVWHVSLKAGFPPLAELVSQSARGPPLQHGAATPSGHGASRLLQRHAHLRI